MKKKFFLKKKVKINFLKEMTTSLRKTVLNVVLKIVRKQLLMVNIIFNIKK